MGGSTSGPRGMPRWLLFALAAIYLAALTLMLSVLAGAVVEFFGR
jgi:hypothetical protein